MVNPYAKIRELERALESAELARVRAEDEARLFHAQMVAARESESEARKSLEAKSDRFEDWMAALMNRKPIHGMEFERPVQQPQPVKRPIMHGADIEKQMIAQYEQDLGIDAIN